MREQYPLLPLPTFTFEVWLALLILAVALLLALSPFAFQGRWGMVPVAYGFAATMFANGVGHIAVSIFLGRMASGVYTAPLLLLGSVCLGVSVLRRR